jgi:hypothetical protein
VRFNIEVEKAFTKFCSFTTAIDSSWNPEFSSSNFSTTTRTRPAESCFVSETSSWFQLHLPALLNFKVVPFSPPANAVVDKLTTIKDITFGFESESIQLIFKSTQRSVYICKLNQATRIGFADVTLLIN